jgi:hypothetical protein
MGNSAKNYVLGCLGNANQNTLNLFYNSSAPSKFTTPNWSTSTSTVPSLYTHARLVSAGFRITFTGSLLNAQGTITLVSAPRDWLRYSYWDQALPITLDMLQTHPSAKIISVPKCYGGECIYLPLDPASLTYTDLSDTYQPGNLIDQCKGCEIYMVVSGTGSTIVQFQVEAMFNYEGIPSNNQFLTMETTVSKSDPISLAHTMNIVPLMDSTRGMTEIKPEHILGTDVIAADDISPGKHEVVAPNAAQEDTLMDKLFAGLGKAADFSEKALKKMSPFLAML